VDVRGALEQATSALPGAEARPGQLTMARAVAEAIERGRHLVVQAGTGTGKSLAYLVPAVLSGRRVVVATATKALQDQLAGKDLPFLAEHADRPFRFSVLKGRSNYLCAQKAREIGDEGDQTLALEGLDDKATRDELARILRWAMKSPSGDRADLPFEPSPRAWSAVSVGAEECPGAARCPLGEQCFAETARQQAEEADVIVVNTHLYGVHLASGGWVLPEHDVVVFDEAHALEDVASATLGLELGAGRFRGLARSLRGILVEADIPAAVEDAGQRLEVVLAPWRGRRLTDADRPALAEVLAVATDRVQRAVTALRAAEPTEAKATARRQRAMKAATALAADLTAVAAPADDAVDWVEGPDHAPVLKLAPVDVGPKLASMLWPEHTAILTSATVPPGLGGRLGMPEGSWDDLDVGSPFDYRHQAMLYVAAHLPQPRHPRWEAEAIDELEALIHAAGGRTLALFTSWRMMRAAAEALGERLPWTLLTQSDLPKPALVRAFTDDETSCLFATMGFWQGVDVPGRSLSLVVLDKIPFPRPDEPLTEARRERAGAAAFATVDLPRAATLLAQGAGRLVRAATDRGVVAVLDPRLATRDYRRVLLEPMPPMRRTLNRADVERFFAADREAEPQ
jgi:ATP-dependent DNA helicase DinG